MNITTDNFNFILDDGVYKAVLSQSKMKFHNFSQMKYIIEIYETGQTCQELVGNLYKTLDKLDLQMSWDERMKMHKILDQLFLESIS